MTIEEAKAARDKLRLDIAQLLMDYTNLTGLQVIRLSIDTTYQTMQGTITKYVIDVDSEII